MKTGIGILLFVALITSAQGQYIIDTGTPADSYYFPWAGYEGPDSDEINFMAQKFTLVHPASVTRIETYISGGRSLTVQLASQIGSNAIPADVLTNFLLAMPSSNSWVGQAVNLELPAGDYFVIYSGSPTDMGVGDLPGGVTNNIGPTYSSMGTNASVDFPPRSTFGVISSGTNETGLRISGSNNVIVPAILNIASYAGISVSGTVGEFYRIDYATSLAPTNWITLTNLLLPASPTLIFDSTAPIQNNRFYRAVAQ